MRGSRRVIPEALALAMAISCLPLFARDLSFEDRVKAQEAIERVYYAHQIGATKPFEAAVPRAVLEKKVRTYLEESAALERTWHTSLTTQALSRELDRMGRNTRLPDRLHEIYTALGNDRQVILECLARPALAGRLARSDFEVLPGPGMQTTPMTRNAAINAASCTAGDTWDSVALDGAPEQRVGHTAIWTGSEMIIWGGSDNGSFLDSGGRYDPTTDTWTPTSTTDAPARRYHHTAVWTGNQVIVWGGYGYSGSGADYLASGGRYDPTTDTWAPTSTIDAPFRRYLHTAVWTGAEMIVWGGIVGGPLNSGGRYDPITDSWTPTSMTESPSMRYGHTAVWTGTRMIIWGGGPFASGGQYDPETDTWVSTSTVGAPEGRGGHSAVWTGTEMFVWGGGTDEDAFSSGGRYDPTANAWSPTSVIDAPEGRGGHTAVWTGAEMIVWGGIDFNSTFDSGGRYDLATDTWSPVSSTNVPAPRHLHTAVWTGTQMIVWGGEGFPDQTYSVSGGRYTPGSSGGSLGADAGADRVVECAGAEGTLVQLHAGGTGCSSLTYTWTGPFPEVGGSVQGGDSAVTLPLGQSTLTLRVTDATGQSATDTVMVTVRDTAPPVFTLAADPAFLWPPNRALVPVHIAARVIDACDPNPIIALVSVTSSEPDDALGPGDGSTTGDIAGADLGGPDMGLDLRAERDGNGPGRVYRMTYRAVDVSGNSTQAFAIVTVPHDTGAGSGPHSKPPR